MSVFGLVVVVLLVAVVALLWRSAASDEDVTARRILADRLARGEISDDEYRSRLDLLRHSQPGR